MGIGVGKLKTDIKKFKLGKTIKIPLPSKETLIEAYIVQNLTVNEVGKRIGANEETTRDFLQKYGIKKDISSVVESRVRTTLLRYGARNPSQVSSVKDKKKETCLRNYGVPHPCQTPQCKKASGSYSKTNKIWQEFIGVNTMSTEFPLGNYSYDFKINNTLIEINPTYTHNSTTAPYFGGKQKQPLSKTYHLEKTALANENGYHCIHVWDWDDKEKVKSLIISNKRIHARTCDLKEVSIQEANLFCINNHIQSATISSKARIGLYYNNELVSLMTFGKPRYNSNYQYELLRLCSLSGTNVVGGASKLFKHFIKKYNPTSIISYCDIAKFSGSTYSKLGFTLERTTIPTRHWYSGKRHITDNLLRQRGFSQLHGSNDYNTHEKGESNEELMIRNGYVEIYDCGQKVFRWTNTPKGEI